jgi:hypothetical protein
VKSQDLSRRYFDRPLPVAVLRKRLLADRAPSETRTLLLDGLRAIPGSEVVTLHAEVDMPCSIVSGTPLVRITVVRADGSVGVLTWKEADDGV